MAKSEQRNIEINDDIWKKVGVLAAALGMTKKELVAKALSHFYLEFKNKI